MANTLGERITDDAESSMKDRFLTFLIGEEIFGIEIRNVMEIVGIQPITQMPEMPDYMKGIVNLRGKIIPVLDVRLRFGKPERAYNDRTCVIVIRQSGTSLGLIVDSVSEVLTIPADNIEQVPSFQADMSQKYLSGIGMIGGQVVLLIDSNRLTGDEKIEL